MSQSSSNKPFKAVANRKLATAMGLALALSTCVSHALDTQTVAVTSTPETWDLEATLEAVNESTISAQTSGGIKAVHFDVNDRVSKGALLIEIDSTQQRAQLAQAEANLAMATAQNNEAQTNLKRASRLLKQGTMSQGSYDQAEAQAKSTEAGVAAARAELSQAKEQLSYTRVTAPYSGIVKARLVELGELVNPGQPLMTGLALQPLRAVADVPQRLAQQYSAKDQIQVQLGNSSVAASKVTLFPYADPRLHSVRLRAELPADSSSGYFPGMWAKVQIQTGTRDAILVPDSALVKRSEVSAIYVQNGSSWKMRQVRAGKAQGEQVEILSGLKAGEIIAVDGYAALAELATAAKANASADH